MKDIFVKGDEKSHLYTVKYQDIAEFQKGVVHEVCATFTLAREIEWSSRLFAIDMKDNDEEGVGTMLEIKHISPAFIDDELSIVAKVDSIVKNELICSIVVKVGDRLIATGRTGQKIVKKSKMENLMKELKSRLLSIFLII